MQVRFVERRADPGSGRGRYRPAAHGPGADAGRRTGLTLSRIFNIREGFSDQDDALPKRFAETPSEGPLKGLDPQTFAEARKGYYRLMGWDESGVPTRDRLAELGIGWAARYLGS